MKKYTFIRTAFFSLLLVSCSGASEENGTDSNTDTTKVDTGSAAVEQEQSPIAADWDAFRNAILAQDEATVALYINAEDISAEDVLFYAGEDFVKEALETTSFEDLYATDFNGEPALEFNAGITGEDEEGNIYESGISFFMQETPEGLRLIYVLAAG